MIARMRTIEAAVATTAPPAAVWALLADASKWQQWGAWSKVEIEGGGEQGPGAVRALVRAPFHLRERVTTWEPGSRVGYELLEGMRVRGYKAEVTLEPTAQGGHGRAVAFDLRAGRSGHRVVAADCDPRRVPARGQGRGRVVRLSPTASRRARRARTPGAPARWDG